MSFLNRIKSFFVKNYITADTVWGRRWGDTSYTYLNQYIGWTFIAIKTIADALALYPPKLYRIDKQGNKEEVLPTDSEFGVILRDLYEFNSESTLYEQRRLKLAHKKLAGNAYWSLEVAPKTGNKFEYYPLRPDRVKIEFNNSPDIAYFEYTNPYTNETIKIPKEDILMFREMNPKKWQVGKSIVHAIELSHFTWKAASEYGYNFLLNDARPQGFLFLEGGNEDSAKILEEKLKNKYQGVRKAGKLSVTNHKIEFTDLTRSNRDLEFNQSLLRMRDDILMQFGAGLKDIIIGESTFRNADEAQRAFQRYVLYPELLEEVEVLNEQLIPKYFEQSSSQLGLRFEAQNPVEKDKEKETTIITTLFKDGIMKRNEARQALDIDILPGEQGEFIVTPGQTAFGGNPETIKQKKIIKKQKKVKQNLKKINKEELREKLFLETLVNEERLSRQIDKFFHSQNIRILEKFAGLKSVKINKQAFDLRLEEDFTISFFAPLFESLGQISHDNIQEVLIAAGIEDQRTITEGARTQLNQNIEFFANEINKKTRDDLNRVITESITEGDDLRTTQGKIIKLFDDYIYGQKNVDNLQKLGVYEDRVRISSAGNIIEGSGNRWNHILENITKNLTGDEQKQAFQSLANIVDVADPIGETVSNTLSTLYDTDKEIGVNTGRAETIARTETNKIKTLMEFERIKDEPLIEKVEWLTARDEAVRPSHQRNDGVVREVGEEFPNGLKYPLDPNGPPEEVINCRCDLIPAF